LLLAIFVALAVVACGIGFWLLCAAFGHARQ
jgi:hypothetical protein